MAEEATKQALARLAGGERRAVAMLAALLFVGTATALGAGGALGLATVAAYRGESATPWLAGAGVLVATRAVATLAHARLATRVTQRVADRQRRAVLDHVLAIGPDVVRAEQGAAVRTAIADAAPASAAYVASYRPQLLATVAGTILAAIALAVLVPWVALLAVAAVVAIPQLQRLWSARLGQRGAAYWQATSDLADKLDDILHGIDDIAALAAAERTEQRLAAAAEELRRTSVAGLRTAMGVYAVTTVLLGVATVGATVLLAWQALGAVPAATTLLAWALLPEVVRPWQAYREAWFAGHSARSAQQRISALLELRTPLVERGDDTPPATTAPGFVLDNVTVRHEDADVTALHELTVRIPGGRTTALLGGSGAGKSTLLALLMRHRDPTHGVVRMDGCPLATTDAAAVRRRFAWVSQDVVLFSGTVAENLRLARPDASDAELAAAADRARLLLPAAEGGLRNGLATEIGDRGRLLSGGQRQRVAIARALLRDAAVLVLDEPTAALDTVNELAVTEAITEATRGRTVIVVSHRPDGLPPVDHVIRLAEGRCVDDLAAEGAA